MADEFYAASKVAWNCGVEQTSGAGDDEYKWTPSCAWGDVQKFDWANFSGKDADEKEWTAKLSTAFGAGSQTEKASKDGDEVTTTGFTWTAEVAKSGDGVQPEAVIYWSVAGTGVEDKDIANWKCSGATLAAGEDTAKAWNADNEVAWADRAGGAADAKNTIGGECAANKAHGGITVAESGHWKVDDSVQYWFSATAGGDRLGNAAAQNFKITTVSGAFTMTVAAGIVATAAVAF